MGRFVAQLALALAIAVGGFCLALPPIGMGFIALLALVPLLVALHKKSQAVAFATGVAVGILTALVLLNALPGPHFEDESTRWVWAGLILFGVYLGMVFSLWAGVKTLTWGAILKTATFAILIEWLTFVYLPFHIGLTQYLSLGMLQISSVTGIWGVSILVWLANLSITAWLCEKKVWQPIALAVGLGTWFFGGGLLVPGTENHPSLKVALYQQQDISEERWDKSADLLILPEMAGNQLLRGSDTKDLKELSLRQLPLITSFEDDFSPKPHNVAALFAQGQESARYEKRYLFAGERRLHTPGTLPVAVPLTFKGTTLQIGLNICFDSCFPAVMRDTVTQSRADLIALPTQDPVTPNGIVQAMHSAYTPFRSAELGVPIVRVDWTVHSLATDCFGRMIVPAVWKHGAATLDVPLDQHETIYRSWGDWFLWLCLIAFLWLHISEVVHRSARNLPSAS
ncbi:MAG: hypothetical protein JST40_06310 [Armatimonadetes bacterium]|nr:hypothetical protein [Armatimonadota bacterium]